VPFMMAYAISLEEALLSGLSSPAEDTRPSGPVDPLRELHSALPCDVAAPIRGGLVSDIEDCENRPQCEKFVLGS
jgi:hypothetical protein